MPIVAAKCILFAWDGAYRYEPGKGSLPDGLFEIDSDNEVLNRMTTPRGEYVFQYSGHEGRAPKPETVNASVGATATIKEIVEAKAETVKTDKRKVPMTAARKAQLAVALAKGRAAKKAKLEAAAA